MDRTTQLRAARCDVVFIVNYGVTGAEEGRSPISFAKRLPVQVIGGGGALPGGRSAGTVLVDDDTAERLHALGNP